MSLDMTNSANKNSAKTGERTILAFDYGTKRIGVAIGQELTSQASGLTTVLSIRQKPNWDEISKLIDQWKPDALVVGIPVHMDETEHEITLRAKKFCRQLQARYNLTLYEADERLSSFEAEANLQAQAQTQTKKGKRKGKGKQNRFDKSEIDRMAAQIILQGWLDSEQLRR